MNDARIRQEALTDGVFPLITNLKYHTPKKILEIYKYQPFLEKRHSQLKTYQEVAPAFLKKPERVIAYLHMNVIINTPCGLCRSSDVLSTIGEKDIE